MSKPILKEMIIFSGELSYNITDMFQTANVYESMYDNYTTLNLTMVDTLGLLERFKISGDTVISLSFNGSGHSGMIDHSKFYDVTSISNIDNIAGTQKNIYTLQCATQILGISNENNLKISYKQKESEIVKSLVQDNMKLKVDVEESLNVGTYIFSNENPLSAINRISKFSQTTMGLQSASFLFYEDNVGYKFKSIENIINSKSIYPKFTQKIVKTINDASFYSLKSVLISNYFNIDKLSDHGGMGMDVVEIDLLNKSAKTINFKANKMLNSFSALDNNPVFFKNANIDKSNRMEIKAYTNDYVSDKPKQYATRAFALSVFDNITVTATVQGNTNITVGQKAELGLMSTAVNFGKKEDTTFSGNYIITGVRHEFSKSQFETFVEFRKPAIMRKI